MDSFVDDVEFVDFAVNIDINEYDKLINEL